MPENGMISALLHRSRKEAGFGAGEIAVDVVRMEDQITVAVAGRTSVDSSPSLRSVLLGLLRRGAPPRVVIEMSAVSYLDVSGVATLLEALKAARESSVRLYLAGIRGQARTLAEIVQLDKIFRSWGSEVEFR